MSIVFGRFYQEATERDPSDKNAVYVKGISVPIWVAINETIAKEAVRRLNDADRVGAVKGWTETSKDPRTGLPVRLRGWSLDDLIDSARKTGGQPPREAIRRAGTLMKAIAAIANGRTAFK